MKKNSTEKLNLRRGASLMIALVIFLLCALAGASAVLMATANAGRFSHDSEQEYYTVSSAALVVIDMMDDLTYTSEAVQYDYKRTWEYDASGGEHTTSDGYTLTIPEKMGTLTGASTFRDKSGLNFGTKMKEHCDKLVPLLNIPEEWYLSSNTSNPDKQQNKPAASSVGTMTYSFEITVKDKDKKNVDERFAPVSCTLVMSENYDLFLTFRLTSGEYAITAYWKADVKVEQKTGNPTYTYSTPDASGNYTSGSMEQNRTLNVTVVWKKENATLSRGQATEGEGTI